MSDLLPSPLDKGHRPIPDAEVMVPDDVEFVVVGESRRPGEPTTARVIAWLGETDDPARVLSRNRSGSYRRVYFARATTRFERVDLETLLAERDR